MPVWNDKMVEHQAASGQVCKFSLYLNFAALRWIPVLLFKHVNTSTSLCACLGHENHYRVCVFHVASTVEVSLAQTTLAIVVYIMGCMLGSDLTTKKHQYRRSKYTGIPLDKLHWNHLGLCDRPNVFQWQSKALHSHNWKTTGAASTLGCHWNHTDWC